jgi:malate dehydrogenase (oxaloacetate-decarboxylating)(NADP+)
MTLLRDPSLNKGTAFTEAERDAFGLRGLLPPRVSSQEHQEARVLTSVRSKHSDLEKYIDLAGLHDRNETLFFRLLVDHLEEMMPIVYTPTVGLACQEFGHIFQRPRGIFISIADRGRVAELLRNWPEKEVTIIVVTDGERILGLGDLGANGMGIPVGKLSLYTACAGVPPGGCLPVLLDVGTDNASLRDDPQYIGLPQPRVTGKPYDELVEEFISAAGAVFPGVLIQFEDFANHHAFGLLQAYRNRICTFNDDIQGTAAVALAGILSALRVSGGDLAGQTLLFLGAGEAAAGIAGLVVSALREAGLGEAEARRRCWLVDSKGLVVRSRSGLAEHKLPYAHDHEPAPDFPSAVEALRPTALIGVSAVPGAFTETVVRRMAQLNDRPIIFALSNPTSQSECTAEQAYRWTAGNALFASGSPFGPVTLDGTTFVPRQGNNSYIFPGLGLGIIAARATRVTDEMFMAAARTLASQVTEADLGMGSLYPPLGEIRRVSARIAAAVAEVAYRQGLAQTPRPANLLAYVESCMYEPAYPDFTKTGP